MRAAPGLIPPDGLYGEFSARFPYEETDDQQTAIDVVLDDLVGRQADGPADLRRCRLRQDRGGAARRLRCRARRLAGRGRGADDAAGAPALQDVLRALRRPAGPHRAGVAAGRRQGARRDQEGHRRRHGRHRRRHARAARRLDLVQESRPADHRRGAAFRRQAQGAAEGAEERRACADAVGDADPAHPAAGADRRARAVADRHAAGRPHGGAHLHLAVRSAGHPRGAAARALSRRPELLRRAAHRRPRRDPGVPAPVGAGGEGRHRARPDAAGRARRHHERLLRRPVRRAAVDHDRRIRPRHPDRQHADRAPRRHVRPGAALPAARPGRALQGARLCAVHAAGQPEADRHRRPPPEGAAVARHARRRLPARQPRPRHPRRRQSARRGAVGPHQGGRLRALPADAGGGGRRDARHRRSRSRTAGRRRSPSARR